MSGDWAGAVLAAVSALVVLALPGLVAMILIAGPATAGPDLADLAVLIPISVALGVGGTVDGRVDLGVVGADLSLAVMPLLATVVALTVAAAVFLRRLRPVRTWSETLTAAARLGVVYLAGLLLVALLGRRSLGSTTTGSTALRVSVDVGSTLAWGSVWLVIALAVAVGWRRPDVLPAPAARWREWLAGPAAGTGAVLATGWLCTVALVAAALLGDAAQGPDVAALGPLGPLGGLGSSSPVPAVGDLTPASAGGSGVATTFAGIAAIVLAAGNLLVVGFGWALGVPVTATLAEDGTAAGQQALVDLARDAPAFWLGPLVTVLVLIFGGTVAALHAPTPRDALRRGWAMGVVLAAVLLLGAVASSVTVSVPAAGGSLHLDHLLAPVLGLVGGMLGGTLGALVAPALPTALIRSRRVGRASGRGWSSGSPTDLAPEDWLEPGRSPARYRARLVAYLLAVVLVAAAVVIGVATVSAAPPTTGSALAAIGPP